MCGVHMYIHKSRFLCGVNYFHTPSETRLNDVIYQLHVHKHVVIYIIISFTMRARAPVRVGIVAFPNACRRRKKGLVVQPVLGAYPIFACHDFSRLRVNHGDYTNARARIMYAYTRIIRAYMTLYSVISCVIKEFRAREVSRGRPGGQNTPSFRS